MARTKKSAAKKSATVKKAAKAKAVIHMNSYGRLTLPASARKTLGLEGEADFQLDFHEHAFVLRPAVVMTLEDAWAYTAEHRGLLARAHNDSRRGRVHSLTEGQLDRIAAVR